MIRLMLAHQSDAPLVQQAVKFNLSLLKKKNPFLWITSHLKSEPILCVTLTLTLAITIILTPNPSPSPNPNPNPDPSHNPNPSPSPNP